MQEEAIRWRDVVSHPGPNGPLLPHDLWTAWTVEPSVWIPLAFSIFIYGWSSYHVWKRAGTGRGITNRKWISFLSAILAVIMALMSPLNALSDVLFSAHMAQHLILILVAAPLLVLSDFPVSLMWALPSSKAKAISQGLNQSQALSRVWRLLSNSIFVWLLFTITMWFWHVPVPFEAALQDETIHSLEHLSFLITALLFWWVLFKHNRPVYIHYGMTIPYLFLTVLQSGILGALMTFTSQPWYPYYATLVIPWGLTPLQDQQLAGLVMWVPVGAVFTLLTIGYFAAWLRALEERSARLQYRDSIRAHHKK